MLWPADLDLVGRDRALPGLALVLDGDALAAALRRILPEAAIEGVHVAYLRYKPGTNCLAGCSVRARGGVFDLYAKAYQAGDDKLNAAWSRAAVPGALGPGRVSLKREGTEVFVFPNDKRLAALARLTDNERRPGLLRRLLPAHPDLWEATPERLAYKPERRWAGRLQATTGARAVVKVYTPAGFVAARSRAEAVAPRDTLRIPRRLGSSQRHGLLAFQWFDALPLDALLQEAGREAEALERVARALAELHGQKPGRLPQQSREADAAALLRCAREIGMLCPSLAKAVEALAHEIASAIARAALRGNAIHGDLHAGQILLPADDTLVLLDFDRAMRGDPAADLGNLIARWERAVLRGELPRERLRARRGALLDSYSSAAGKWPARVALYTSAALLRSAPDIFRLREPYWDQRIAEVHRRCRELLDKQHPASAVRRSRAQGDSMSVEDLWRATSDPAMPYVARALDRAEAERLLSATPAGFGAGGGVRLLAARVSRYKAGSRCLIEYDLLTASASRPALMHTVIGKTRVKGADVRTHALMVALRAWGLNEENPANVSVPEPLGIIPELHMWLQRKVAGRSAAELLALPGRSDLAERIAGAIHQVHSAGLPARRQHTIQDELAVLADRLSEVGRIRPRWRRRLERLLGACRRLGVAIPRVPPQGIHRDFYPDHVLVDGDRLHLIDFDLYRAGDPALDVGNFIAHLTEHALRCFGEATALAEREAELENAYVALAGEAARARVRAYATLTLARHVSLSTQLPGRGDTTEALLSLCEARLGLTGRPSREPAQASGRTVMWAPRGGGS